MIRRLRLENFRRHADTEIHFNDDEHLILIAGNNGVGKTTIFEALLFGLYGEGREGRRNLDRLVRRGYELEGMTVEVVFERGDTEYRVVRRRVGRSVTAVLYGNEEPLVESVQGVNEEVARILSMDVHAFKLAVMAQQKELDGLAAHTPATRRRMISKLLRVDLVTRARDAARSSYNTLAEVVKTLGAGGDEEELKAAVEAARARVEAQEKVLVETEERVRELGEKIASYAEDIETWEELKRAQVRAETAIAAGRRRVGQLHSQLERISRRATPTEEAWPEVEGLREALLVAERRLAQIQEAEAHAEQMEALAREVNADRRRLADVLREIAEMGDDPDLGALGNNVKTAFVALEQVSSELEQAVKRRAAAQERVRYCEERSAKTVALGDVCLECGQPVTAEHRVEMTERLNAELADANSELKAAETERANLMVAQTRAAAELERAKQALADAERRAATLAQLEKEAADLRRRIGVYQPSQAEKVDETEKQNLEEWKTALEAVIRKRREYDEALAAETARQAEEDRLRADLEAAEAELEEARAALEAAQPSEALTGRIAELADLRETLETEKELAGALRVEKAVADGDLKVAQNNLELEAERAEERRRRQQEAAVAAGAAEVLAELSDHLVREVRPALGVAVSEILAQLSNNRFTRVAIGDDYEILVEDDGELHDLAELSGGERDLVALAVRLGLSSLVAERDGNGGPGFLILDECFGSQDEGRRQTIMDALRGLRSTYRQILLISHVGGLEEACDRVLEVRLDEDRTTAEVRDL